MATLNEFLHMVNTLNEEKAESAHLHPVRDRLRISCTAVHALYDTAVAQGLVQKIGNGDPCMLSDVGKAYIGLHTQS